MYDITIQVQQIEFYRISEEARPGCLETNVLVGLENDKGYLVAHARNKFSFLTLAKEFVN